MKKNAITYNKEGYISIQQLEKFLKRKRKVRRLDKEENYDTVWIKIGNQGFTPKEIVLLPTYSSDKTNKIPVCWDVEFVLDVYNLKNLKIPTK